MADSSRDTQDGKPAPEKKPETVLLTAEELKAIAGGIKPSGPTPVSQDVTNKPTAGNLRGQ